MKKHNFIRSIIFSLFFLCAFLIVLVMPDQKFSVAERRPLKEFPNVTFSQIKSGRFMEEFEDYLLDQFPFRDRFRMVKAWTEQNIFGKKNNNEIYIKDGFAAEMVYPMNETSMNNVVKTFKNIYDTYLKESGSNVYFSMIPDKNYFLARIQEMLVTIFVFKVSKSCKEKMN